MKTLAVIFILTFSLITNSYSAVIYDESIDGDLPIIIDFDVNNSNYLGVLGAGQNQIKGSTFTRVRPSIFSDEDHLFFSISEGYEFTSISILYDVTRDVGLNTSFALLSLEKVRGRFFDEIAILTGELVNRPDLATPKSEFFLPSLGEGDYRLGGFSGAHTLLSSTDAVVVWDYTITLDVTAPVPIPATSWLFISGLGLLGFKRKHNSYR